MKVKLTKRRKRRTVTLHNNIGAKMRIPEDATIGDLIKMGMRRIRIVPKGVKPEPDEWSSGHPKDWAGK